jgi:hypothetical protein
MIAVLLAPTANIAKQDDHRVSLNWARGLMRHVPFAPGWRWFDRSGIACHPNSKEHAARSEV